MCYTTRKKIAKILENVWQDGYISGTQPEYESKKTLEDCEDELIKLFLELEVGEYDNS